MRWTLGLPALPAALGNRGVGQSLRRSRATAFPIRARQAKQIANQRRPPVVATEILIGHVRAAYDATAQLGFMRKEFLLWQQSFPGTFFCWWSRAHCVCSICERNCVPPLDVDRTSASASKFSTSESRYRTPRPSFKHRRIPLRSRRFNVSTDNFQRSESSLRVTNRTALS
jgi:hypothetical protein